MIQSVVTVTLNPTIDRVMEVPGLQVGGHLQGRMKFRIPAGKALNVSRALAALGTPNIATGWVGRDAIREFTQTTDAAGATPRYITITGATRENVTLIDPVHHTETHIRDAGPTVNESDIERLTHELSGLSKSDVLVVFMGSLPPGLSPVDFGRLLDICIGQGAAVAVDTSGEALTEAARRPLRLLKPNLQELSELLGQSLDSDDATVRAGRELNRNIPLVIVTLGARGAYCFAEDEILFGECRIAADRVRSTVGCGDALLAGFLAAFQQGKTIESSFRHCLAVAAASAMNVRPAVFDPAEVRRLEEQDHVLIRAIAKS